MTAGRGRRPGERAAGARRTRCRSWSSTTAGTTTSTPPRRDAPLADRMAVDAAMAFADVIRVGEFGRLRGLRRRRLRGRRRRPVQEPVPPILQPHLRQPRQRGGLPLPPHRELTARLSAGYRPRYSAASETGAASCRRTARGRARATRRTPPPARRSPPGSRTPRSRSSRRARTARAGTPATTATTRTC